MAPPPRRAKLAQLGALELAVLDHLWGQGEADVHGVHQTIGIERGITVNTIGSALERLYKKGLARRRKVSHAFRYEAALSSEQFAARRVLEATRDLPRLSGAGLLSAFVDLVVDVDDETLDRLERLIHEKRKGRGGA